MKTIFFVLIWLVGVQVWAQKTKTVFKMPANVTSSDYSHGRVLVKVKKEYKDAVAQLSGSTSGGQIKSVPFKSVSRVVNEKLAKQGLAMRGPVSRQPSVDISLYYEIALNRGQNVEGFINDLYATGYFEIVEPCYAYRTNLTPNDPDISSQYYLTNIKAFQAWDITTQGDTTITIAIVDTGARLTHPDLKPDLYRNWKEYPPNGIDDDGNGFIDDYQGWDFIGADTLNLDNPNFIGDNDPTVHEGGEISHGTWVGGCASARANNGVGIAGVGYQTKLMFTKHTADNQLTTDGSIYDGYDGILYAANQGIKIISLSWGGSFQSQIIQDFINHVTVDLGCLIVAAAGNGSSSLPTYPGAYDHVLSVAATDQNDKKASFSSYGNTVDIAAPGVGIFTTGFDSDYESVDGTSFSTPITAGAAALVWSQNPTFTGLQVAEQLRVTADAQTLYAVNPTYINKLGKGRLDIQRALTIQSPSVRASSPKFVNQSGGAVVPGQQGFLTLSFTNYLQSTSSGIQISISSISTAIVINQNSVSPGIIAGNSTITNALNPFQITINQNAAQNTTVNLLITYADGSYTDYQYITLLINPSFIDINSNLVNTTMTSIGRIGYQDPANQAQGSGFIFDQQSMLYEMGLIMGTSATNLYNNVRGAALNSYDEDFSSTVNITEIIPGLRSDGEIFGEFSNSVTPASQALIIDYRSLVWKNSPYDKFVIIEYHIKNPTAQAINGFHFGIFADWDITTNGQQDAANWYPAENLGYVYPAQAAAKPYAGIQLLTGTPGYYAIDNDQTIAGSSSFGLYDGFTDTEKYTSISTQRLTAGLSSADGNDVSHVVSAGPLTIGAGQVVTLAFALHAAANFNDLKTSATYADSIYNYTLKAAVPVVDTVTICYNSIAHINASGATKLKWYKTFTGPDTVSFFTGNQYTTGTLTSDTTFYVSNADNSFESVRAPAAVVLKANPKITTSGSTTFCDGQTITLSVAKADSYLWSTGETTQTIQVGTADVYSVTVKDNTLSCQSTSSPVTTTVNANPQAAFSVSGDLETSLPINFADQSTDATSWYWQFGDGTNSTSQNPSHTYSQMSNYNVLLTVTATDGCQNTTSNLVAVITGLEDTNSDVFAYPNPTRNEPVTVEINDKAGVQVKLNLINLLGQPAYEDEFQTASDKTLRVIPLKNLSDGIFILQIKVGSRIITKKIVKAQ
jgi:serine protease